MLQRTPAPPKTRGRDDTVGYSIGTWVILGIAVVSTLLILFLPVQRREGVLMWTFSHDHANLYYPVLKAWNDGPENTPKVTLNILSGDAITRRTQSGFTAGVKVADLVELERSMVGRFFTGPLEDVGFVDLTEKLKEEGLDQELNGPSFSPWTNRGHVFGLPHDVHPVMLAYRADIVEAAGIDVSTIQTWADFEEKMRPLMREKDPDGTTKHYLLNIWYGSQDQIELLILQAGGSLFDAQSNLSMATETNARVLARIMTWIEGPRRIAIDAPEFNPSGNELRLRGKVIASFMPDWLGGVWRKDMPGLTGKIKLMPLPAWEWDPNKRRTSVWGGTMLGIAKSTPEREAEAWKVAKMLYLGEGPARGIYENSGIISPAKKFWTCDFYDKPSEFFCGQAPGRLYINLAPDVPLRPSSPYITLAKARLNDAVSNLYEFARGRNLDEAALQAQARLELQKAEASIRREVGRNVFLKENQP